MIFLRHAESAAFIAVGSVAAGVHFLAVWLVVRLAGIAPQRANMVAFLAAFAVSYAGHYRLTFHAGRGPMRGSIGRWLAVSVGGFLLNQSLYVLALRRVPHVHYLLLLVIVTGLVTLVTYLLGKYWAFAAARAGRD